MENYSRSSRSGLGAFAIRNPHLIIVLCLIVIIMGGLSLIGLPKDLLPPANLPAVQILSFYSGMPVEEVERSLTERFERYTGQAVGMSHQESKSLLGVSMVKNFFDPSTDLNTAIAQTTSLVMSVLRKLPPGTQPPLILPFDPMAAVPLTLVAISSPDMTQSQLNDLARNEVKNGIQSVPNAMAPAVMGGADRQVVVYIDPSKLKSFNLSPVDIVRRLTSYNTFVPSGDIKLGEYDYQIVSNGIVDHVKEMDDFPIRSENGVPIYLKQVGESKDASAIQTNIVRVDGKPQVYLPVYRQPGANSLQIVDQVGESMKRLQDRLGNVTLKVVADQSEFIRHAIHSIAEEAIIGGGLAAIMVLLFLGNPRATGGILLSLPLSILCAFLGLKAVGQTLNAMTLGGLALSIGVLVDNSIVVLENIMQKMALGLAPERASAEGAQEVMMPVLSSTLATLVVFFPVVFLDGVVKVLFSALAKSVMFAMIGSFLVASTVIPLFCARFLRTKTKHTTGLLGHIEAAIHRFTDAYGKLLASALGHRKKFLMTTTISLVALSALAFTIGSELFPRADSGSFIIDARLKSGTRIEVTGDFATKIETKLREWIPAHDLSMVITNAGVVYGFPAAFTPNTGPQDVFFNIELTSNRVHSTQYYAKIIRQKFKTEFPDVDIGVELGGLLTSALNGGLRAPIDVQVVGPKLEKSHEYATSLAGKIKQLGGATDVRVEQRIDAPQISLDVDRKNAGRLGLTTDEVIKNVVSAVSGSSTFNPAIWVDPSSGKDYLMGVRVPDKMVSEMKDFESIPITGSHQDRSVPLKDIAKISFTKGPTEMSQVDLENVVDIYADAQDRDIGGLSTDIQKLISRTSLEKGYSARIRGEISEMQNAVSSLGGGFILAAILVYLILVVQFRSFLLPAIIMVTVPMGMVGIIVMLSLTHTYFSIQAAIGAIFMIGIAVANGVLLIEFIAHHARESKDLDTAVVNGAKARLRPILMTSLASILGLVPMAIGLGHGSEANIPLGRAVIGGQLLSTSLTLFIVPVLFRVLSERLGASNQTEIAKEELALV